MLNAPHIAQDNGNVPTVIGEIMTSAVECVHADAPLNAAAARMKERGIRHLVVVDSFRKPVGVFSERDMLGHIARTLSRGYNVPSRTPIGELMTAPPKVITLTTSIAETAALMAEHKFGCLPVVNRERELVGIVTVGDLLNVLAGKKQAKSSARPQAVSVADANLTED